MFDRTTAARYAGAIHHVTHKVREKTFRREYGYDELHALVLEVAFERHELWEVGIHPVVTDLTMHTWRAVERDRRAKGWTRPRDPETGQRYWRRPESTGGRDAGDVGDWRHAAADHLPFRGQMWDPYRFLFGSDDYAVYPLMPGWPPFDRTLRRKFARHMETHHPRVCDAFEAIDLEPKPPAMQWERWNRGRRILRTRLLGVYADELDDAMLAVTRGRGGRAVRRRAA